MPKPESPAAAISLTHIPHHSALPVPLIVEVLTLVVGAIRPVELPPAMELILPPPAPVGFTIGPSVGALALHLAGHEVSVVLLREYCSVHSVQYEIEVQD